MRFGKRTERRRMKYSYEDDTQEKEKMTDVIKLRISIKDEVREKENES